MANSRVPVFVKRFYLKSLVMKQFPFKSIMAVLFLLWWQTAAQAQESERYPIIPKPQTLIPATGEFVLGQKTKLMVPADSASFKLAADFLRELVNKANGVSMGYAKAGTQAKKNTI